MAAALQAGAFLRPAPGSIGRFALEITEAPEVKTGKPCALRVRTWALDDDDALHKGRHDDSTHRVQVLPLPNGKLLELGNMAFCPRVFELMPRPTTRRPDIARASQADLFT